MGDFKRNTKLLVITEDGMIQPLGEITKLESTVCSAEWDWDSTLKIGKVTQSIRTDISGTNVNIEDIPTCMLEAAKKRLENIIDDRKIREMLIPVPSFSKMFETCNQLTTNETKKIYVGAARASGKSLRDSEQIKKVLFDSYPESLWSRFYAGLDRAVTKDACAVVMGTSKLPKLDPNDNSFTKRLENIWINDKKKVVTVKKPDGSVIKVKCDKRDEFDPYVGTALALAYKEFGSKSKFRKYVDEIVAKQNKKTKEKVEGTKEDRQ